MVIYQVSHLSEVLVLEPLGFTRVMSTKDCPEAGSAGWAEQLAPRSFLCHYQQQGWGNSMAVDDLVMRLDDFI